MDQPTFVKYISISSYLVFNIWWHFKNPIQRACLCTRTLVVGWVCSSDIPSWYFSFICLILFYSSCSIEISIFLFLDLMFLSIFSLTNSHRFIHMVIEYSQMLATNDLVQQTLLLSKSTCLRDRFSITAHCFVIFQWIFGGPWYFVQALSYHQMFICWWFACTSNPFVHTLSFELWPQLMWG